VLEAEHILLESAEPPGELFDATFDAETAVHHVFVPEEKYERGATDDLERGRITRALEACGGNQTRAAKMLGISRRTLINRIQEFNLPRPKKG
jgi:DNA-binding NtrC family response regulator